MTNITLKKKNSIYSVEACGHASGSVETCASISTLVYTLLGYLDNFEDGAQLRDSKIADGYAFIEFEGGEVAEALYNLICVGFLQIRKAKEGLLTIDIIE